MDYVDQIGDAQFQPPYSFPGVKVLSFRLSADLGALTALCDDILNIGDISDRGFEYRPIIPYVDLEILYYPQMEYAFFPGLAFTSQHECYVRIFVMKYIAFGGLLFPDGEVAIFCPFLAVDNPWSAFAGRDVLGYPKLMGTFDPFTPVNPYGSVKTLAFASLIGGAAASLPVVTIGHSTAAAAPTPPGAWPWGDINLFGLEILDPLICGSVQMKQFRDAEDPFAACYQAILQSYIFVEAIGPIGPLPPVEITINEYPFLKLASSIGVAPNTPLTPIWQYHMELSFSFGAVLTAFENS
jgi:hypothetical protein